MQYLLTQGELDALNKQTARVEAHKEAEAKLMQVKSSLAEAIFTVIGEAGLPFYMASDLRSRLVFAFKAHSIEIDEAKI